MIPETWFILHRNHVPSTLYLRGCSRNVKTKWILPWHVQSFPRNLNSHLWHAWSRRSFLIKKSERIVCVHLVTHLHRNGLYEVFQSACRQLHSTEIALLCEQNDNLQAVESRANAILVLLNLSAAFDTTDHENLIKMISTCCGIRGDPPKCFYHIQNAVFNLYK